MVSVLRKAAPPRERANIRPISRPARGSRRAELRATATALSFLFPSLVLFVVFVLFPFFYSIVLSFEHWRPFGGSTYVGLSNYSSVINSGLFGTALKNVLLYALYTIPVGLVWAIITALAVTKVRGMTIWRTLLFAPSVVSTTSAAILWGWLLDPSIGLFHHLFGSGNILGTPDLAMIGVAASVLWSNTGYWMVIFLAAVLNVPGELYEAATIDGASVLQRFRRITWPLISPTVFFYLTVAFSTVWFLFVQVYILTGGGPGESTLMPAEYVFTQAFTYFNLGQASAVTWLFCLIAFALIGLNVFTARWWVHTER